MTEKLLTYPCDYPIKVVGEVAPGFHDEVFDVVSRYDPSMTTDRVSQKTSRKGNFVSISFMLTATSEDQIEALLLELNALVSVRLVL